MCVSPSSPTSPARSMAEDHRQVLHRDVVDDVVVGALEERRVDRGHGTEAARRHAGRERDRVRLGDADVEESRRVRLRDRRGACPTRHRRRDGDDVLALGHQFARARARRPSCSSAFAVATLTCLPVAGSCPGGSACHFSMCSPAGNPFPFCVMTCTRRGPVMPRTAVEDVHQAVDVVPVDRTEVAEAELLEQHARREEGLHALLPLPDERVRADGCPSSTSPILARRRL